MEGNLMPYISTGLNKVLSGPLNGGELGVIMARAGVGKTAFLTLLALEEIYNGGQVLHVCIDEPPDKIKGWYEELVRINAKEVSLTVLRSLLKELEPKRFIVSFLHNSFSIKKLHDVFANITEQADFFPSLVVLDGLDFERYEVDFFESFKNLIREKNMPVWTSARTHRHIDKRGRAGIPYPCDNIEDLVDVVLLLDPEDDGKISMRVLKDRLTLGLQEPGLRFHPQVFTICED